MDGHLLVPEIEVYVLFQCRQYWLVSRFNHEHDLSVILTKQIYLLNHAVVAMLIL